MFRFQDKVNQLKITELLLKSFRQGKNQHSKQAPNLNLLENYASANMWKSVFTSNIICRADKLSLFIKPSFNYTSWLLYLSLEKHFSISGMTTLDWIAKQMLQKHGLKPELLNSHRFLRIYACQELFSKVTWDPLVTKKCFNNDILNSQHDFTHKLCNQ